MARERSGRVRYVPRVAPPNQEPPSAKASSGLRAGAGLIPAAVLASVLLAALVPAVRAVTDPDLFVHLRLGEWILAHHAVPHHDPLSRVGLAGHREWFAYSWLFEVPLFLLYRAGGPVAVMAATMTLAAAVAGSLWSLLRRYEPRPGVVGILAGLAVVSLWPVLTPRPWLFTILFFILEFRILLEVRQRGRARKLLLLAPLFVLWANLHIQFVYGLALLAGFALEPLAAPAWRRFVRTDGRPPETPLEAEAPESRLWIALAVPAAVAACLINPYGWKLGRVVADYATQGAVWRGVQELAPPTFRAGTEWIAAGLLAAAVWTLVLRRPRRPLVPVLLLAGVALFLHGRRDVWCLVVPAATALAMARPGRGPVGSPAPEPARGRPRVRGTVVFAVAVGMLLAAGYAPRFRNAWHREQMEARYPVRAVAFVKSHLGAAREDGGLRGPLLNPFDWGSFLTWALPELPVCVDGRTNLYGPTYLERVWGLWDGHPGWRTDPLVSGAGLVIADPALPLTRLLAGDPGFQLVYRDSVASVFSRRPGPS